MQKGLGGRRVALYARSESAALLAALEAAGAQVEALSTEKSRDAGDWHGAKYAALVLGSCGDGERGLDADPRLLQLIREFLLADKPIAVFGDGLLCLEQASGTREDALMAGDQAQDAKAVADELVAKLADRLDEGQLDDMSDQSFPASDPPSVTPSSAGAASVDGDARL